MIVGVWSISSADAQQGTPRVVIDGQFGDWQLSNAVATHAAGETNPARWSYREVAPWSSYCAVDDHASDGYFDFYAFNRTQAGATAAYRAGYDGSRHCLATDASGTNLMLLHSLERYIWLTRGPGIEQSDRHEITYACSMLDTDNDQRINAMACSRDDITRGCLGSTAAGRPCTLGGDGFLEIHHCTDGSTRTCTNQRRVARYGSSRFAAYDYFAPGGGQIQGAGGTNSAFKATDPGFTTYVMSNGRTLTRLPDHLIEMSVPMANLPNFSGGRVCATMAVFGLSSTTLEPRFTSLPVDTISTPQCAVMRSTNPTATPRPTARPRDLRRVQRRRRDPRLGRQRRRDQQLAQPRRLVQRLGQPLRLVQPRHRDQPLVRQRRLVQRRRLDQRPVQRRRLVQPLVQRRRLVQRLVR